MNPEQAALPFKHCRICGDYAIGFNFNVVTCESCKSFFRRHALKSMKLTDSCKMNSNCTIDRLSRRECKHCRLLKCFECGMSKDVISVRNMESPLDDSHVEIVYKFSYVHKNSTELKSSEFARLLEVQNAISAFRDEHTFPVCGEAKDLAQVCNLSAYTVKQVVKYCKSFSAYTKLDTENQLNLLKNFYPEKTAVRIAFMYDEQKDGFVGVQDEAKEVALFIKMDHFRQDDLYSILRLFVQSLSRKMQNDATIRDLILTHLLFKPRPNLTCLEFVRYEHYLYRYLLRRYLEHKHCELRLARRKYCSIMRLLKRLDQLTVMIKSLFAGMHKSNLLTQILVEMYE